MASEDIPQSWPIVTRSVALKSGEKLYFTGKPCKHGHIAQRWARSAKCRVCEKHAQDRRYAKNYEHVQKRTKEWVRNNPEKRAAHAKKWADNNPEKRRQFRIAYREIHKVRHKEWRDKNREKIKAWSCRYRETHKDQTKRQREKWRAANPDRARSLVRNRRARLRSAEGSHTERDIKELFAAQKGRCAYCREKLGKDFHVDHIIPINSGGSNWKSNLQLTCGRSGNNCNSRKHDKDPLMFARELGRLI